jgi:hypothetical protein
MSGFDSRTIELIKRHHKARGRMPSGRQNSAGKLPGSEYRVAFAVLCERRLPCGQQRRPVRQDGQPRGLLTLGDDHEESLPISRHIVLIPNRVDPEA